MDVPAAALWCLLALVACLWVAAAVVLVALAHARHPRCPHCRSRDNDPTGNPGGPRRCWKCGGCWLP